MNARSLSWSVAGAAVLAAAIAVGASGAGGRFVEPDVQVLHQFDGAGPAGSAYFGWAVSELGDVDGDHAADAIVGEAGSGPDAATGATYVYSGRTGRQLYRFVGAAGDSNGFAIADAGDTNHDHVHDILVGSPGSPGGGQPGHVDLYSGRTGALLHQFIGTGHGDAFGWSVSSAGDVDRDHHADVLIGAAQAFGATGPGYAVIYSGRTYQPIRTLTGDVTGDRFGSAAGWTADVDHDRVPDQILGAQHAGPARHGVAYVYSGRTGRRLFAIQASAHGGTFGSFFVAGVGDVDDDGTPDLYAADYSDTTNGVDSQGNPSGRAGVYSGRDGHELLHWVGEAGAGVGPGRGAGDVNDDGRPDLIVGSYTSSAGASQAGRVQIFSGKDGSVLRTITSTTAGEQLGFDAVGLGDVNRDGLPDELVSAANGDHVYVIAGTKVKKH